MLARGTFDGATDTETFLLFVKAGLIPRLRPGQIVVMDNLWPHKNPKVDQLITSVGARVMYLPPYSPDYNPIEMAINKMKSLLRKLGKRTVSDLLEAIGHATQAINVQDATNFIKHCGYCATRE